MISDIDLEYIRLICNCKIENIQKLGDEFLSGEIKFSNSKKYILCSTGELYCSIQYTINLDGSVPQASPEAVFQIAKKEQAIFKQWNDTIKSLLKMDRETKEKYIREHIDLKEVLKWKK